MIYFDTITTRKPSARAIQMMIPFFEEAFGVPLQPHRKGQELFVPMEVAYQAIYDLVGANHSDFMVFTSSGAEAVTQAVHTAYINCIKKTGKNHCIASMIGEASSILAISRLEEEGVTCTLCPISISGYITSKELMDVISPRTALLSISSACALTGVVQPLEEIVAICRQRDILLHVDITHSLGKQSFTLDSLQADFITFNGEQLGAPKGTGVLFTRKMAPSVLIAGEDESMRYRGGALNVPLLVALAEASKETKESENYLCTEVARLRDFFERSLKAKLSDAVVLFSEEERLPHISCIAFPGIRNEALLFSLNKKNLFASMGGGIFQQIEIILEAAQIDKSIAQCALTFSFSQDTSDADIEKAVVIIEEVVKKMKRLSKDLF